MAAASPISSNHQLADFLAALAGYYALESADPSKSNKEAETDKFRKETFERAAEQIRVYSSPITSGAQAKRVLHRIGESTVKEIDEFLSTGSSIRLRTLESKYQSMKQITDYFRSFYGIGPVKAQEYYRMGLRTWEDLWQRAPDLLPSTRLAIYWREHLVLRIPREEILQIRTRIESFLAPTQLQWEITGSFRRCEETSGDIDILVRAQSGVDITAAGIMSLFQAHGLIPTVEINGIMTPSILANGEVMASGIVRLDDHHPARRLDIKVIPSISYPYGLLHFTGSWAFNQLIRARAIEFGVTLNEYTLFSSAETSPGTWTYQVYLASNEESIFEQLGVTYLPPSQRTKEISHLTLIPPKPSQPIIFTGPKAGPAEIMKYLDSIHPS